MVAYNNKKYYINIVETKPSSAVSIIETDCEVDFAPPLDYKEPEKPAKSALLNRKQSEGLLHHLSSPHFDNCSQGLIINLLLWIYFGISAEDEPAKKIAKFSPFTGFGRRLDGRPSTESVEPDSSPILKQHQSEAQNGTKDSKSSNPASRQPSGKLVFGSNVNQPENEKSKVCLAFLWYKLPSIFLIHLLAYLLCSWG